METRERSQTVRLVLGGTFALSVVVWFHLFFQLRQEALLPASLRWMALLGGLGLFCLLLLLALVLAWSGSRRRLVIGFQVVQELFVRFGVVNLLLLFLLACCIPLFLFSPSGRFFTPWLERIWVFWLASLLGAWLVVAFDRRSGWGENWAFALCFLAAVYLVVSLLPGVTAYPFSLGWSEGSRYYYASLFFSDRLFGDSLPWPSLHPSRYVLQSIPFIIPGLPLWGHRLWQVGLWVIMTTLGAFAISRRLPFQGRRMTRPLLLVWMFLYLFQGPVYYHLYLGALPVLLWFDSRRFWRSLLMVALGSAWAGISRINWVPVPAMIAAALYLLETPFTRPEFVQENSTGVQQRSLPKALLLYLWRPFLWGAVGVAAGLGAQLTYALFSGNTLDQFGSHFTSDLLWYRLLPNSIYFPGILPGILVVSLPLFGLIVGKAWHHWRAWHPLRLLGAGLLLLALFAGGLVVSVKIGGGGNLHNMDAYLLLLLLVTGYVFFKRFVPDHPDLAGNRWLPGLLLLPVILVPAWLAIQSDPVVTDLDTVEAARVLDRLQVIAGDAVRQGGEVLFISQRQALVFNLIHGVPLVPEYETVTLQEMAMARNTRYLQHFYDDLDRRRFAVIISQWNPTAIRERSTPFAEENNAWVEYISRPLYQRYHTDRLFKSLGIEILLPIQ